MDHMNRKFTLNEMRNMSIDQILELYNLGYTIEDNNNNILSMQEFGIQSLGSDAGGMLETFVISFVASLSALYVAKRLLKW